MSDTTHLTPDDIVSDGPPFTATVTCYPTSPQVGNRRGVCLYDGDKMLAWVADPDGSILANLRQAADQ